jgi:hypothetical protein
MFASQVIGGTSLGILAQYGTLRGLAAVPQNTALGQWLNHGRYVRIGPGKMDGMVNIPVLRFGYFRSEVGLYLSHYSLLFRGW